MRRIRILIADDHTLVRQALAQMLQTEPDFEVVGQAADGEEAFQKTRVLDPDIVLMDIHMPRGREGIEATRRIVEHNPRIGVIMLTMERQDEYLIEAIKAGAKGYLLKNANSQELIEAIHAVAAGEAQLDPAMARKVLEEFRRLERHQRHDIVHLTEREIEILQLVAQGASNREIATKLEISEKTVRNRLSVIFDKLHINNRTEAALYALREGYAQLPSSADKDQNQRSS
jgi:NarL family two-component system response regulator LiaR